MDKLIDNMFEHPIFTFLFADLILYGTVNIICAIKGTKDIRKIENTNSGKVVKG